jgi:hypothetical protein
MMIRLRGLSLLLVFASVASADPADDLTAQGEQFARDGEYTRAIEAFKKADALAPSAKHACMIGLAYTRRELWSQAEIFLARCKTRATEADPLPDWFAAATTQLADKLKGVDTAALDIRVEPPDAAVQITVSSFAPDETFAPRTIHLVPGTYVITATAPDRASVSATATVKLGADNVVTLKLPPRPQPPPPPPPPPRPVAHARSPLPRYLWIGAGAAAVVGVGFHVFAFHERSVMSDAADKNDLAGYQGAQGTFEFARGTTIGLYAAAAVAAGIGLFLRSEDDRAPVLTGAITHDGAMIGFEVRR